MLIPPPHLVRLVAHEVIDDPLIDPLRREIGRERMAQTVQPGPRMLSSPARTTSTRATPACESQGQAYPRFSRSIESGGIEVAVT